MSIRPIAVCGLVSVFLFGMVGCLSSLTTPNVLSNEKLQSNLIVGKTTQDEVTQIYGQPTSQEKTKTGSKWTYIYDPSGVQITASAAAMTAADTAIAQGMVSGMTSAGSSAGVLGRTLAGAGASHLASSALMPDTQGKILIVEFHKMGIVKGYNLN